MKFDYYAATLPELQYAPALEVLHALLPGKLVDHQRGRNGYTNYWTIEGPQGILCTFMAGGRNRCPNAFATGVHAPDFINAVRDHWPGNHNVTRVDAAEEFDDPGAWDKLSKTFLSVADQLGLEVQHRGDFHRSVKGRTLYIGSRKSLCFLRLYEKGIKERADDPLNPLKASLDWIRLEVEIKPQHADDKLRASTLSPLEIWGFSPTSRAILEACCNSDVAKIPVTQAPRLNDARLLDHAVFQYGNLFERMQQNLSSWGAVGLLIGATKARLNKSRR